MATPVFVSASLQNVSGNNLGVPFSGQYLFVTWSQVIATGAGTSYPTLHITGINPRNIVLMANHDQIATTNVTSVYKLPAGASVDWSEHITADIPANLVRNGANNNTATTGDAVTNLSTSNPSSSGQTRARQPYIDRRPILR